MMGAKIRSEAEGAFGERVKRAVIWRSGSQIVAQVVAWVSTFMVIRLLEPTDYGLFAMTQVVLVFLNLMNGYGFANAVIRSESVTKVQLRQVFGMLLLLNGGLALAQLALAPLIASYFRQPMVADLLMVQALLYFATPFIALPHALLSRAMDFRRPAQIHLVSAVFGAATAIGCALSGWGVWTLVAAPMAIFYTQAIGMTWAARSLMWPSFRFAGSGALMSYGGTMMLVQFFWFIQSQSDVFIAGRLLDPHLLGIYTTGLFLTQIIAAKFVPPLNEVAFAAYSRIQDQRDAMQTAFLKAVRLIMLVALPAYFGLAVTAGPFVLTFLGTKWAEAIPIVAILAAAMPLLTLQILFAPATNALGRPGIALKVAMTGTALLPIAFLIGVQWGISGLAWGWVGGMSLLTTATAALSLPAIGVSSRQLAAAVAPGLLAALAMAAIVKTAEPLTAGLPPPLALALLILLGAGAYGGWLVLFARSIVVEVAALARSRPLPAAS
jgi:O-antigen/teichoic acid export membrane protein